jgi:hypothetical protein
VLIDRFGGDRSIVALQGGQWLGGDVQSRRSEVIVRCVGIERLGDQ